MEMTLQMFHLCSKTMFILVFEVKQTVLKYMVHVSVALFQSQMKSALLPVQISTGCDTFSEYSVLSQYQAK